MENKENSKAFRTAFGYGFVVGVVLMLIAWWLV